MARQLTERHVDEIGMRLVEAALKGDILIVNECLNCEIGADVNYMGAVNLRVKRCECVLREEISDEVNIEYEELRTDVNALFAASHSGHVDVVRRLLSAGADVNQKLFRGYATTAAAREGRSNILDMLLKAGASQEACEDALLEASNFGESEAVQLLICSDMPRPDAAAHALVSASSRGFVDVVTTLIKNGVDINCMIRVLLRSVKPSLHANVDCMPLIAAVMSRQISVVKYLLEAGARTDCLFPVGAWTWDPVTGEELRVGACLGEPYNAAWCAVEYYESSGKILNLLLQHNPPFLETPYLGRTLLCHAILCQNFKAVEFLMHFGANSNFPMQTKNGIEFYPIHLAARLGCIEILKQLISNGCDVNSTTSTGETPLMISAKFDHSNCFRELITSGADMGLVSNSRDHPVQLARRSTFSASIINILSEALTSGSRICSSNLSVFSPLHFVAASGNAETLQMILHYSNEDINRLDGSGLTPLMVAAEYGHIECFKLLVMAGADITVKNPKGKTIISIIQHEDKKDSFEQILLDAVLAYILTDHEPFRALHYAACKGDASSIIQLLKMGFNVDSLDENGYSPLMLAAIEGHSDICKTLLLQGGAECGLINDRNETALFLARRSNKSNSVTKGVLLDHLAHLHVLCGEELNKHTREGKGNPHLKNVKMLKSGILTWGKTSRRNVACKVAAIGPSSNFLKRRSISDGNKVLIFHVVTMTGREVHFESSCEYNSELWIRGINLIVKEVNTLGKA